MSNKYSSDNGMQKLFEGFRRSLNESDYDMPYGSTVGDVRQAEMDAEQRERDAARKYVYKEEGTNHLIHHEGGTFSIPKGGGQMSKADREIEHFGFTGPRDLADAANAGDKNAIYLIDMYTR
tara:strand:+ start:39 stop:404 length:366 start_codon:yes stop_codon:yes gene_type:complete